MDEGYLHNRKEDFVEKASKRRAIVSRHCEVDKADQRFYQGQIEMFDAIFGRAPEDGIPRESIIEKMWKEKGTLE